MRKYVYLGSKREAKTKSLLSTVLLPLIFLTENSALFFNLHGGEAKSP